MTPSLAIASTRVTAWTLRGRSVSSESSLSLPDDSPPPAPSHAFSALVEPLSRRGRFGRLPVGVFTGLSSKDVCSIVDGGRVSSQAPFARAVVARGGVRTDSRRRPSRGRPATCVDPSTFFASPQDSSAHVHGQRRRGSRTCFEPSSKIHMINARSRAGTGSARKRLQRGGRMCLRWIASQDRANSCLFSVRYYCRLRAPRPFVLAPLPVRGLFNDDWQRRGKSLRDGSWSEGCSGEVCNSSFFGPDASTFSMLWLVFGVAARSSTSLSVSSFTSLLRSRPPDSRPNVTRNRRKRA